MVHYYYRISVVRNTEAPKLLQITSCFWHSCTCFMDISKTYVFLRCSTSSSSKSIASLLLVPTDVIHLYPIFFWNTFLPYISPWFYKAYFESVLVHILSKNVTSLWIKFVYTLFLPHLLTHLFTKLVGSYFWTHLY